MNSPLIICEGCLNKIKELDEISKSLFKRYIDKHLFNDHEAERIGNLYRYRIGSYHLLAFKQENDIVLLSLVPGLNSSLTKS